MKKFANECIEFFKEKNITDLWHLDNKKGCHQIQKNPLKEVCIEHNHPKTSLEYKMVFKTIYPNLEFVAIIKPVINMTVINISHEELVPGYHQIFADRQGKIMQTRVFKGSSPDILIEEFKRLSKVNESESDFRQFFKSLFSPNR